MQFYAIEIARYAFVLHRKLTQDVQEGVVILTYPRNRAGLNDWVYEKAQKSSS